MVVKVTLSVYIPDSLVIAFMYVFVQFSFLFQLDLDQLGPLQRSHQPEGVCLKNDDGLVCN